MAATTITDLPEDVLRRLLQFVSWKNLRQLVQPGLALVVLAERVERYSKRFAYMETIGEPISYLVLGGKDVIIDEPKQEPNPVHVLIPASAGVQLEPIPDLPIKMDETSACTLADGRVVVFGRVVRYTDPMGDDVSSAFRIYVFCPFRWEWVLTTGFRKRRSVVVVPNGSECRAFGGYRVSNDVGAYNHEMDPYGNGTEIRASEGGGLKCNFVDILPTNSFRWIEGERLQMRCVKTALVHARPDQPSTPLFFRKATTNGDDLATRNQTWDFEPCHPDNRRKFADVATRKRDRNYEAIFAQFVELSCPRKVPSAADLMPEEIQWRESDKMRTRMTSLTVSDVYAPANVGLFRHLPASDVNHNSHVARNLSFVPLGKDMVVEACLVFPDDTDVDDARVVLRGAYSNMARGKSFADHEWTLLWIKRIQLSNSATSSFLIREGRNQRVPMFRIGAGESSFVVIPNYNAWATDTEYRFLLFEESTLAECIRYHLMYPDRSVVHTEDDVNDLPFPAHRFGSSVTPVPLFR